MFAGAGETRLSRCPTSSSQTVCTNTPRALPEYSDFYVSHGAGLTSDLALCDITVGPQARHVILSFAVLLDEHLFYCPF